jgi:ribose 5-phosphate isomerase A
MPDIPSASDNSLSPSDVAKRAAAERALEMVEDGMTLGLGTGSTAAWFVRLLSERIREQGLDVVCVATSSTTQWLAEELGVPLRRIDQVGRIDLTVDGTDEFDPALNLIKGGGAALLQEKIVASASERLVVVADAGKRVATLGAFPLPVEVVRFGWQVTQAAVVRALVGLDVDGRRVTVRPGHDGPLTTDEGHHILDLHLGRIGDPVALAAALNALPGVVEHGLFIGMADAVVVGREDGSTEIVRDASAHVTEAMRNEDA